MLKENDEIRYTPDPDFCGSDSVMLEISDTSGLTRYSYSSN